MIDPSKDKFAYFKDNIQTAEDKEFDASQYYYHREELSSKSAGAVGAGVGGASLNLTSFHGGMSGVDESNAQQSAFYAGAGGMLGGAAGNSFLGSAGTRVPLGGGGLPHELHRMNSSDLGSVMKSRSYPAPGENKAPDMSEFPALGSRSTSWTLDQGENAAAAASRSQGSEFVIQKEDFPALSSFGGANSNDKASMQQDMELKRHSSFTASANDSLPTRRPSGSSGSTSSIGSRAGFGGAAAGGSSNVKPRCHRSIRSFAWLSTRCRRSVQRSARSKQQVWSVGHAAHCHSAEPRREEEPDDGLRSDFFRAEPQLGRAAASSLRIAMGRRTADKGAAVHAATVLLQPATGAQDNAFIQVPPGDAVLHLLRDAAGRTASVRGAGAVQPGMEISWRAVAVAQAGVGRRCSAGRKRLDAVIRCCRSVGIDKQRQRRVHRQCPQSQCRYDVGNSSGNGCYGATVSVF
ncbi:hypothetical protein PINS_up011225 [Pythium insidiosum]|nr:hypothetical protein PINS_up011225 [Pythium insidiosum]